MNARLKELYKIISECQLEIDEIREGCTHSNFTKGNYMWAPGHINEGMICDNCNKYLGEYKTFVEWIPRIKSYIECICGKTLINRKGQVVMQCIYPNTSTEDLRGLDKRLEIINNSSNYNITGDKLISEKEFLEIIKQYLND